MKTQKERLKKAFITIGINTTEVKNEFTSSILSKASSIVISKDTGQVEFTFDSEGFLFDVRIYGDEK